MVKPVCLFGTLLSVGMLASQGRADSFLLPLPQASAASSINTSGNGADVHLDATTTGSRPAWARFASGTGNIIFLTAGTLLPLVEDGEEGKQHTLRTADSLLTSTIITELLKNITHEKRPDGSDYKSFPSGHATAAFAVATMQSYYHPKQSILWYAGATAIAASRVKLHRHYTHDVIAGAAVGILTSRLEIKQRRGLLFYPFISGAKQEQTSGLAVEKAF